MSTNKSTPKNTTNKNRRTTSSISPLDYAQYCKEVRERIRKEHKEGGTSDKSLKETRTEKGKKVEFKLKPKESKDISLVTWNVAGLRACIKKNFINILQNWDDTPEIIALQEVKTDIASVRDFVENIKDKLQYKILFNSGRIPGYAGVALLYKTSYPPIRTSIDDSFFDYNGKKLLTNENSSIDPETCRKEFWDRAIHEGRIISAEFTNFFFVTSYVPNSGANLEMQRFRQYIWEPCLAEYLANLQTRKPVIYCGDLNVAADEYDVHNPETLQTAAGYTLEERQCFQKLLRNCELVDAWKTVYGNNVFCPYTYFGYRGNCRITNNGWRLDYFILSKSLQDSIQSISMTTEIYPSNISPTDTSAVRASDHLPLHCILNIDSSCKRQKVDENSIDSG